MVEDFEADWRTQLLSVLTNPNVAYMLMLVGIYGLLLEGYNPGAILPGVVGAICLLLALYAFQILSVNYAGLALMGLGVALIIGEAFAPSFGALGTGGIAAFVIGSIMLFDDNAPGFQIARSLIGAIALAAAILMLLIAVVFMRTRRTRSPRASSRCCRRPPLRSRTSPLQVSSIFTAKPGGPLTRTGHERPAAAGVASRRFVARCHAIGIVSSTRRSATPCI